MKRSILLIFSLFFCLNCSANDQGWFSEFSDENLVLYNYDDQEFIAILKSHPSSDTLLYIDNITEIPTKMLTDLSLMAIGENCPSLDTLRLIGDCLTDEGMLALAKGCHELKDFEFYPRYGEGKMTDKGLEALAKGCPQLECVDITGHTKITDEGILSLVQNCPSLETVFLCGTSNEIPGVFTDESLMALAGCPNLKALSVAYNPGITFTGLEALLRDCPSLEELDIVGIITDIEFQQLHDIRPDVFIALSIGI